MLIFNTPPPRNLYGIIFLASGRLFAWGSNSDGQLGLGNTDDKDTPCEIKETPWEEIPIIQLGAGSQYSALLTGKVSIN